MALVYGTPLFFRHFGLEARCSNYGNTVLVKRENGDWWLGHIQDIDGDLFFINFDSCSAGPSWIHARHIWPHVYFEGGNSVYMGKRVQVAVRNEPGGPLIFRPGSIAYVPPQKYSLCWNVNLDDHVSHDHLSKCKFVYESQIVMELPLAEELCFYRNSATFLYKKYVIPFKQAHLIKNLDAVSGCLFPAPRPPRKLLRWGGFASRFFVQFGTDFATFVVAEEGQEVIYTEDSLKRESLLAACESLLVVQPPAGPERSTLIYNCHDTSAEGFPINDLPHPILAAVLLRFHARVLGRMHRVCMLWHLMLPEHIVTANVLIDISVVTHDRDATQHDALCFKTINSLWNDEYNLTMVLDQMVTSRTKTLTLHDDLMVSDRTEFERSVGTATGVLHAKGIKVPVIIIRNCMNCYGEFIKNTALSGKFECHNFSKLTAVCDQLLIINHDFTVGTLFRATAFCFGEPQVIPEPERAFIRPYCHERGSRVVRIDRLLLRSAETVEQHVRLLLLAANMGYPLINQFVYNKMTCIYKRWLQTLAYPDDWVAVRNFLNLFNGFYSDGTPQRWDALDLRELDMSSLNNITLAAIDEIFQDADSEIL